jgi:predicted transcriptional regulator of viral defense system
MESALNYHGIIPEGVYSVQSVSTRKTNKFTSKVGVFNYQTIKKELYFGYQLVTLELNTYRMASLEKAVLDFLYLRSDINDYESLEALRWNKEALMGWMTLSFKLI